MELNCYAEYKFKQKQALLKFTCPRSQSTSVFKDASFIKTFKSAKEVAIEYNTNYRTIRRHIKSGEPIKN